MPNSRHRNQEKLHYGFHAMSNLVETIADLRAFAAERKFRTIYADPPWQFQNRTGKVAPEHKRLTRYETMPIADIKALPVNDIADSKCHLYLWVPNALLPWGLEVMSAWGFEYKTNIVWEKIRHDGQPDGRGVGFYFRNVTELLLFGIRGDGNRTLSPGRSQVNIIRTVKREHSRKPDEFIPLIEACSPGPYIELFARGDRPGWAMWGDQAVADYEPTWETYANHTTKSNIEKQNKNVGLRREMCEANGQLLFAMERTAHYRATPHKRENGESAV